MLNIRILMIKRSFIPFSFRKWIGLRGKITKKYHIILKCLSVFPLLQPYVKSVFFIHLTELLMD